MSSEGNIGGSKANVGFGPLVVKCDALSWNIGAFEKVLLHNKNENAENHLQNVLEIN